MGGLCPASPSILDKGKGSRSKGAPQGLLARGAKSPDVPHREELERSLLSLLQGSESSEREGSPTGSYPPAVVAEAGAKDP